MMFDLNDGVFSALSTEKPYDLDITNFNERGKELGDAINRTVRDTQSVVIRSYPNRIIMTLEQYNDLTHRPDMLRDEYMGQEFWLYKTPYNVMEVILKDAEGAGHMNIIETDEPPITDDKLML